VGRKASGCVFAAWRHWDRGSDAGAVSEEECGVEEFERNTWMRMLGGGRDEYGSLQDPEH
jgi:hypothetical protein